MLGFITIPTEGPAALTGLGERLLATTAGSDEERELINWAVTHAPALEHFRPIAGSADDLALDRMAARVSAIHSMARAAARRRARSLMELRRQVSEAARAGQPGLGLPLLGEELDRRVALHNAAAKQRMLDWLSKLDPKCFEEVIGELLRAMGHGEVRVVGGSGDGGVDVEARVEDQWGHGCRVAVQAKRWARTLGRKPVDELLGVLVRRRCDYGILITTSGFSRDARKAAADDPRLRLVDGSQLVDLLAKHGVLVGFGKYGELIELAGSKRLAERRQDRRVDASRIGL